jgi:hypothetical protein
MSRTLILGMALTLSLKTYTFFFPFFSPFLWISPLPKRVWRVLHHKGKNEGDDEEEMVHFNPHIERARTKVSVICKG